MAGYAAFAAFYDELIADVDYAAWAAYILQLFDRFSAKRPQQLLDLACGTGNLTLELLARDIDVIGVDASGAMLAEAAAKGARFGDRLLLLCQDMRALDLYGTVDGAVCMLDSLNHLLKTADIREVFRRLGLFIERGGLLIFDVNTPYKHKTVLGDHTFTYETEDCFCVWQNRYLSSVSQTAMQLDFFVQTGTVYERYTEYIRERAYALPTLRRLLEEAGFAVRAVYGEQSFDAPQAETQRAVFVAENTGRYQR